MGGKCVEGIVALYFTRGNLQMRLKGKKKKMVDINPIWVKYGGRRQWNLET